MSKKKQTDKKEKKADFVLDKVTLGTRLVLDYKYLNERTHAYKELTLREKENWQGSFAGVIHDIAEKMAKECTLDLDNQRIRDIRVKTVEFEGINAKATLVVYLVGSLDPFEIKTHKISIGTELKEQAITEARAFIEERSRQQGDLFDISGSVVRVNQNFKDAAAKTDKKEVEKQGEAA